METAQPRRTGERDRELIIITLGIVVTIAVIVGFLLFIRSDSDPEPVRSGTFDTTSSAPPADS